METEETVETMEGVLVKTTEVGLGDSDGVTTVVDDGTCNRGERSIGGRDIDDTDTIAVGVREGDEEEEEMNDGDCRNSLRIEELLAIVLSRLSS
jgi:hypothetical protein